jgi:hypothetical protein
MVDGGRAGVAGAGGGGRHKVRLEWVCARGVDRGGAAVGYFRRRSGAAVALRYGCCAAVRLDGGHLLYAGVVVALWVGRPAVWASWRGPVFGLLGIEAVRIGFDLVKFGKPASYHSYLAKVWGLVLAVAVVTVFAAGHATVLLTAAIGLGVACNLEGIAMSLMLPVWRNDVKTLGAAWRLRRVLYSASSAQSREVVSLKPATGASASMESGLCKTSGAVLGR